VLRSPHLPPRHSPAPVRLRVVELLAERKGGPPAPCSARRSLRPARASARHSLRLRANGCRSCSTSAPPVEDEREAEPEARLC
jgi:hypothetical protein